ncbi:MULTISPECIES: hypothetical protein [unclassified Endozoicomonas]
MKGVVNRWAIIELVERFGFREVLLSTNLTRYQLNELLRGE